MSFSTAAQTKIAALKNYIDGITGTELQNILKGMLSEARPGTLAAAMLTDVLTNDFEGYPDANYLYGLLEDAHLIWTSAHINGLYTVFIRYQEALETAARTAPTANMKAAASHVDLTNEAVRTTANEMLVTRCITIINTPDAMAAILKEATEIFATHNNTTPEIVIQAYSAGHPVARKDMDRLIQQAVVELAKASFTWTAKDCKAIK